MSDFQFAMIFLLVVGGGFIGFVWWLWHDYEGPET